MKNRALIILLGLVVVLMTTTVFLYTRMVNIKADRDRQYNNLSQQLYEKNKTLILTRNEFRIYGKNNKELDSLLRVEKIKKAAVRYVTKIEHVYHKDTVNIKIEKTDSIGVFKLKPYDNGCISATGGYVNTLTNELVLENATYRTKITNIGHEKRVYTGRKFLGIFKIKKKQILLTSTNSCGETTTEELKIEK